VLIAAILSLTFVCFALLVLLIWGAYLMELYGKGPPNILILIAILALSAAVISTGVAVREANNIKVCHTQTEKGL